MKEPVGSGYVVLPVKEYSLRLFLPYEAVSFIVSLPVVEEVASETAIFKGGELFKLDVGDQLFKVGRVLK